MTSPLSNEQELDTILAKLGASNIPGTDGKYQEVDPVSIAYVKKELAALIAQETRKARIDEWDGIRGDYDGDTSKETVEELGDGKVKITNQWKKERIAELEAELATLEGNV